ncbi:hypothetical protein [Paracoccus fontiphilus]|uniref:Crescentin n=1 Tax=Paracoccus fontiphilus TaxID=1815556 RepID=A0ABV7IP72_9RHOB|nr:hypothetical protein [Paracoccus fontiphilus]
MNNEINKLAETRIDQEESGDPQAVIIAQLQQEVLSAQRSEADHFTALSTLESSNFDLSCQVEELQAEKGALQAALAEQSMRLNALSEQTLRTTSNIMSLEVVRVELSTRLNDLHAALSNANSEAQIRTTEVTELKLKLTSLDTNVADCNKHISELETQLAKAMAELARREADLSEAAVHLEKTLVEARDAKTLADNRQIKIDSLINKNDALHKSYIEIQEAEYLRVKELAKAKSDLISREIALSSMADERENLINQAEKLNRLANRRHDEILAMTIKLNETLSRVNKIDKERRKTNSLLKSHQFAISELHSSTSWRVTAPMRALKTRMQRLKKPSNT